MSFSACRASSWTRAVSMRMTRRNCALLLVMCGTAFPVHALTDAEMVEIAKRAANGAPEAVQTLERLAQGGATLAEHFMGVLYIGGKGITQSDVQAAEWFLRAARKGHLESMHNLAVIHERSTGTLKDLQVARSWYLAAAEKGFARSQARLGEMIAGGLAGQANRDEALGWIGKAAAQNEPRGLYLLGMMRMDGGPEIEYNVAEAARLLGLAAEARERDAQFELALLYGTGTGVPRDESKALHWLRKSAAQGQMKAQYYLGGVYAGGRYGVERDPQVAVEWLRKSALQGYGDAEYALGLAYLEGSGIKQDPNEAFGWLRRAARHGNAEAIELVRKVEARRKPAGAAVVPGAGGTPRQ